MGILAQQNKKCKFLKKVLDKYITMSYYRQAVSERRNEKNRKSKNLKKVLDKRFEAW